MPTRVRQLAQNRPGARHARHEVAPAISTWAGVEALEVVEADAAESIAAARRTDDRDRLAGFDLGGHATELARTGR